MRPQKPCSLIGIDLSLMHRLDTLLAIQNSLFGCVGNLIRKALALLIIYCEFEARSPQIARNSLYFPS